jgi:type I restriction enzyme S subunit
LMPILKQIEENTPYVTVKHLSTGDIKQVEIPLPSLDEQRRIAGILQKADRLRRLRRYARRLSDSYLQPVFLEMFDHGFINEKAKFSEVVKIDRKIASKKDCSTLPYIGLEHIEKDSGKLINEYKKEQLNMLATNFRFTPRHVLLGKLRPYLNKVLLPNFDGVCTTEILPLLPADGEVERSYLFVYLKSQVFVKWASNNVSGANLPRLAPEMLADYMLPLPPISLQRKFDVIFQQYVNIKKREAESERQAEHLFQSLLQGAFSGEL